MVLQGQIMRINEEKQGSFSKNVYVLVAPILWWPLYTSSFFCFFVFFLQLESVVTFNLIFQIKI